MRKYSSYLLMGLFLIFGGLVTGCKGPVVSDPTSKTSVTRVSSAGAVSAPAANPYGENNPGATKSIIRIKAGADSPITDSEGHIWQPDQGFGGGDTIARDDGLQITNTTDPMLYRTEHYGMDSFSCKIPNGKYTVKLYFAETFESITGVGQRIFSFNVQGHDFKDFDVWQQAGGPERALVESVPADITDGKLQITFTSNVENPEINAIEIIPQS